MSAVLARRPGLLRHALRVSGTGLCFLASGIWLTGFALLAFPLISLLTRDAEQRRLRVQRLLHHSLRTLMHLMHAVGLLSSEVRGREGLAKPGRLIVANHPTFIDAIYLLAQMPEVLCIAKGAIFSNPFTGPAARAAGYISNAQDPGALIEQAAIALRSGHCLLIFPEGSRTRPGKPVHFARGAAQIALTAHCPVVPVKIHCDPPALTKGQWFWQIPRQVSHLCVTVQPEIQPDDFLRNGRALPLAARDLNRALLAACTGQIIPAEDYAGALHPAPIAHT